MNKSMRIFFWLLITVNVIFFAVMKSGVFDSGPAEPVQATLHAEKISLLDASPITVVTVKAAPAAVSAVAAVVLLAG